MDFIFCRSRFLKILQLFSIKYQLVSIDNFFTVITFYIITKKTLWNVKYNRIIGKLLKTRFYLKLCFHNNLNNVHCNTNLNNVVYNTVPTYLIYVIYLRELKQYLRLPNRPLLWFFIINTILNNIKKIAYNLG